jgi:hypothetical protein
VSNQKRRFRLSDMSLDFVSLVAAGDDPLAQVVIAKSAPEGGGNNSNGTQEATMGEQIAKDDLDPEVVAYIEGLESEVDTLSKQVEDQEKSVEELTDTLSKMAPKDDEAAEAISKALLAKADPAVRELIEKQQADLAEATRIAKAERDARLDREFISKAEALPMLTEDRTALGGLLRRISEALTPEDTAAVEKMLKAANEQIEKSNLFTEFGRGGANTTVSANAESAAAEIRKADPTLTPEQALAKAYEANPDLLAEAMTNQEG